MIDWLAPGIWSSSDPDDSSGPFDSMEITSLYYGTVGTTNYFRMDLAAAPLVTDGTIDYEFHIDSTPGGAMFGTGAAPESALVADNGAGGLQGIDFIVDKQYSVGFNAPSGDFHTYQGFGTYNFSAATSVGFANSGATLEWSVPFATFNPSGPITIWAAAQNPNVPVTYDLSGPIHTPEPGTILLMGVVGLVGAASRFARRRS